MTPPDAINSIFESSAGLLILLNVRRVLIDRKVRGVSVWPILVFTLWGFWNLFYYPHLSQWLSFLGGILVVLANTLYLLLLLHFIRRERRQRRLAPHPEATHLVDKDGVIYLCHLPSPCISIEKFGELIETSRPPTRTKGVPS